MQENVCSLVHGKAGESKKQEFRTNPLDKTEHPASKRKMHELKESRITAEGKHHNSSQEVEGDHNCQDPEPPAQALGVQHRGRHFTKCSLVFMSASSLSQN